MVESERVATRNFGRPGGADGLMLRVDGPWLKLRRRRRRLLIWLGLGLLLLGGTVLGLVAPQAATTIEIWGGAGTALIGLSACG